MLDVVDVTAKLSLKPSQTRIAGQSRPGGKSVWDESMWEYEVRPHRNPKRNWSSLEQGLTEIISAFRSRKRLLRNYQRRFKVSIFCGHFSSSFNGGPTFSPLLLKELGNLGVELFLDTYSSSEASAGR
jgi:Domain of unknown function (DUF4279)